MVGADESTEQWRHPAAVATFNAIDRHCDILCRDCPTDKISKESQQTYHRNTMHGGYTVRGVSKIIIYT